MDVFTRSEDLGKYVGVLTNMVEALVQDMARITRLTRCPFSEDKITNAYLRAAEGPTVFERVLISQDRLTEAEVKVNHVADMIYCGVAAKVNRYPMPEHQKLRYFEVKFSDGVECNAAWVCIRGTDKPTVVEAQWFAAMDSIALKLPVVEVCEIDEQTARGCYDFSNEADWPIFSRGGGPNGKKIEG